MKSQRLTIYLLVAALVLGGGSYGIIRGFSTGKQASTPPFAVEKVSKLADRTEITLLPKVHRPEIPVDPVLNIDSVKQSGKARTGVDGRVLVVFSPPPSTVDGAVLVFPAVSVEVQATTSQPASGDTILGPAGHKYQITKRVVDEARGVVDFHYQPTTSEAPSVRHAVVRAGDKQVLSVGVASSYRPFSIVLEDGIIRFPMDVLALMESNEAVLEVGLFRELVEARIPLP